MGVLEEVSRSTELWGNCPNCGELILLRDCQLFSLAGDRPETALHQVAVLKAGLKNQRRQLAEAKRLMGNAPFATHVVSISGWAINGPCLTQTLSLPSLPVG